MMRIARFPLALAFALGVSGCSWFGGEEQPSRIEQLKLPPDLTSDRGRGSMNIPSEGATSASDSGSADGAPVLPQPDSVTVERAGRDRWLAVAQPPEQVWNWVDDFVQRQGVELARRNPTTGVAETEWLYTKRPLGGGVFAPTLPGPEDATVADRYRFRVERGDNAESSNVFVAHRRVRRRDDGWQLGDSDPFLEAELLRSMLVFFGYAEQQSRQALAESSGEPPSANLERVDGEPRLVLNNEFFDAWRRVGLALDRAGFTVSDRNRSERVYFVRYDAAARGVPQTEGEDGGGLLSGLAFWRDDTESTSVRTYRLVLEPRDGVTRVRVRASEGEPAPATDVVQRILGLVAEQLR